MKISKYWKQIARYDAETTTYSTCAGAGVDNPFVVPKDGRLVGLRAVNNGGAATQLVNGVQFKLTCSQFTPETIEAFFLGSGLLTAPAFMTPPVDHVVDQEVKESSPIKVEARNVTADTPVGVDVSLWGCFEA